MTIPEFYTFKIGDKMMYMEWDVEVMGLIDTTDLAHPRLIKFMDRPWIAWDLICMECKEKGEV